MACRRLVSAAARAYSAVHSSFLWASRAASAAIGAKEGADREEEPPTGGMKQEYGGCGEREREREERERGGGGGGGGGNEFGGGG
jgi:hypothetical protein